MCVKECPVIIYNQSFDQFQVISSKSMTSSDRDYEDIVLMRLRQAEERKRLIEQMQKEDDADT